jgi:hypothetical protein
MEPIGLQSREEMKSEFLNVSLLGFYSIYLPKNNFPQLYRHAVRVSALFGNTYVCDQLLKKLSIPKNEN